MVCYLRSSCPDLPVSLVDFWVEVFPSPLHQVFQGGYVVLNYIDFDWAEQNIFRGFVDELRERGKSDTLKNVGDITFYGADE